VRLTSDQQAALALIALATAAFALTYTFDEVPPAISQGMGPAAFPRLVAIVIVVLALWLFVAGRNSDEPLEPVDRAVPIVLVGAVLFMGALWLVGIIVATAIAIFLLGILWGERRWLALAANAILLPGAIWLLFVKGLNVTLPTGVLGRMLGF
jgi:putative tricarboxylic transport membrane protein